MNISIRGAREHNLRDVDVEIGDGLTVITGVSGSGKTSLAFDTLYHEARRRFLDIFALGAAGPRLAPAAVDEITGLGPAIAVGQNLLNRNPGSTLATASGLHPFLRLLYANFGVRHCPRCGATLAVLSDDEIVERVVDLAQQGPITIAAPLVRRAAGSHATLLKLLVDEFGESALRIDGQGGRPEKLDPAQGHSIEIEVARLAGVVSAAEARRALETVSALSADALIVRRWPAGESWALARAPVCVACGAWFGELRPLHFHQACPHCRGAGCAQCQATGLHPQAAAVRWEGLRLPDLLARPVDDVWAIFQWASLLTSASRLRSEIERRLDALRTVGLGYLALDRPSPTLSRGEAQRVRLAVALTSRLEDMLHVLDEPTVGQHPADVARLLPAFRRLGGPVVYVEHDRLAASQADRAIDLGPGAGSQGGRVIFAGAPADLWAEDSATGRFFSLRQRVALPGQRPAPQAFLTVRGAHLRNLAEIDAPIPLGRLTVITGVSGSGKSTFVEDVLVASLTAGQPAGCRALEGPRLKPVFVDQSPIGQNPRSNPATYTKLADIIRDLFADGTGLSPSHFSFNRPEGACPACEGMGAQEVKMRYLPSTWIPCAECDGQRFSDPVLAAKLPFGGRALSIADFFALTIWEAAELLHDDPRLPAPDRQAAESILGALCDIGLGYLTLGQPSPTLSGGEAQRVKLARTLGKRSLAGQMLILDEPSTGLHPHDLAGLLTVLDRLARAGATVVVVEHNTDIIRAADWVVDLGPGAGPAGGRLLYAGPPAGLLTAPASLTGQALRDEDLTAENSPNKFGTPESPTVIAGAPSSIAHRTSSIAHRTSSIAHRTSSIAHRPSSHISIRAARANNLRGVDADFPKGKLTVVTGVSGSGKSSLVGDVLEAEARRRFLEMLSMYERQGAHEGPEAPVGSVTGLGVAVAIGPERLVYNRRATVGTATELSHHLAVLLATVGERNCPNCSAAMIRGEGWRCPACGATAPRASSRHFLSSTYASACLTCHGVGTLQKPNPSKLIIHAERPLCAGAMYSPGFFPKGYLGEPYNGGYYYVRALAERYGFDPDRTPWNEMTPQAQQAFLFGDPEPLVVHTEGRSGRRSTFTATFPGFYGWIRDWDVGGTYTDTVACPECAGSRLRREYLAVTLAGYNIHELSTLPLSALAQALDRVALPPDALASVKASLDTARRRLRFLAQVGLGYLHLDRVASTLSAGEAQRARLAGLLGSGLTSLTVLLDEPTRGLHGVEVAALLAAVTALRDEGNTVIVVEHDPLIIRAADFLIELGPGAGEAGGQIVAQGAPAEFNASKAITAAWLRGERRAGPADGAGRTRRAPAGWLTIRGARANNLRGEPIRLPLGVLAGVCGVSGSGKSTLLIDTLGRALAPKKQTTSVAYEPVEPGEHDAIEGAPPRTVIVDQSRAGVHSPLSFLDLGKPLRALYAASADAVALGISEEQLGERCSACNGRGVITVEMEFLPDVHEVCEACSGTGLLPEAWDVRLRHVSLPQAHGLTIDQIYELFGDEPALARPLAAARAVGLGYLVLRQPGYALSGGEAQRLKIARELCKPANTPTLYILDEPTVGQHLEDVARLNGVLVRLVDAGHSVVVVEHHPHLLAACDWLLELGPGGGPDGGRVIASGPPETLAAGQTPIAAYLRDVLESDM
jgi:excinuclease ABC subunit A